MALDTQPNDEEKQEKLENDFDTPFSEPADIPGADKLPKDYPLLDTDVDEDEWYNEGKSEAAGSDDTEKSDKQKT